MIAISRISDGPWEGANKMTVHIMLVEDEIIVAMDMKQRLETMGYTVVAHATSGAEAVRIAREARPNLILMDIKIRGEMDGIETAAKIRELQDIPVIYVTAFADEATLKRASLTEAFGYLIKPIEDRELRSVIEVALYKHQMEMKLRESEERYALAARASNDGIWDWNLITAQVYYSPRWGELLGIEETHKLSSPQEWLSRVHPEDIQRLNLAIDDHLQAITPRLECEYRMMHEDGGYRWMQCHGLALFDSHKKPLRLAGSQSDISVRKQIEDQLIHRTLHDDLTQLPNRALFLDRLRMALLQTQRSESIFAAVLFLDIDHFKVVNDSLGHVSGDKLLDAFSARLKECLRPGDTIARFGGDEFAILVDGIKKGEEAVQIADRVCTALRKPFSIEGHELFTTASIGIVFVTSQSQSVEDLLRDADSAMYYAKYKGRARYEVFDISMHDRSTFRLQQEIEIRRAITNKEFSLYYQPIFRVKTLELVGFEALIRWQHPARGLLLPTEFIRVAEETGLIIPIGEWVLQTACAQAQAWNLAFGQSFTMAVNLSALQLNDDNLIHSVRAALDANQLDPQQLELELTESVAMLNLEKNLEILKQFQALGVSISIDDFGTGYSSLDHIRFFPTNNLKIDRSFIQDLRNEDFAIVSAIVTMAHKLQLRVIAEGVETENQLSILSEIECDHAQGFFLGKAFSSEAVGKLLRERIN
jgi:diguanylate cyclase (GGDEF)-like protein/PAS domain S-box-containing protein